MEYMETILYLCKCLQGKCSYLIVLVFSWRMGIKVANKQQ